MKITSVEVGVVSHRLDPPVGLGIGTARKRDAVVVMVRTDEGLTGYGEAHHGLAPTSVSELIRSSMSDLLVGKDPENILDIRSDIEHRHLRSHGVGGGAWIALSGIDMALWDLKGKFLNQPVCRLLGSSPKRFRAYAGGLTLGYKDSRELVDEVSAYIDMHGFTAAKLRLGDTPRSDAQRVQAVREHHPDLELLVDINTQYDYVSMTELLPVLEDSHVGWIEEPFPPAATNLLGRLRALTRLPLAAGENLHSTESLLALLADSSVDYLQPDVSKVGGITELVAVGHLAGRWSTRMAPHTSHTALNYSATLHAMSTMKTAYIFEAGHFNDNHFSEIMDTEALGLEDGNVRTPAGPGLGIEVDEAAFEKYPALPGRQSSTMYLGS